VKEAFGEDALIYVDIASALGRLQVVVNIEAWWTFLAASPYRPWDHEGVKKQLEMGAELMKVAERMKERLKDAGVTFDEIEG
jgi:hypothetical protein